MIYTFSQIISVIVASASGKGEHKLSLICSKESGYKFQTGELKIVKPFLVTSVRVVSSLLEHLRQNDF